MRSGGSLWRFAPGSLEWPRGVSRVKLILDHDPTTPVGVATHFEDRPDGLHGRFSIARTEAGDRALVEVRDGVRDSFSIGPRIEDGDWVQDGRDRLVKRATLVEVTLTAFPSDVDARAEAPSFHWMVSRPMVPVRRTVVSAPLPSGRGFQLVSKVESFYDRAG